MVEALTKHLQHEALELGRAQGLLSPPAAETAKDAAFEPAPGNGTGGVKEKVS